MHTSPIKFVIADDHEIFRSGLRLVLSDDVTLSCVGEAENGKEVLKILAGENVDIVLLDLQMPEMDGKECLMQIARSYPRVRCIMLTMFDEDDMIFTLMENGAAGYLLKSASPGEIKMAIYSVYENGNYFNDRTSRALMKKLVMKGKLETKFNEVHLSKNEINILRLICEEYTTVEIGDRLNLSARTVEGTRSTLLTKIGVKNTAGLVVYAIRNGIYA